MSPANHLPRRTATVTARKAPVPKQQQRLELFQQQATAPLDTALPNEILEQIFALCPTRDLVQLALASRRLSSVSTRFLYHTIPNLAPNKFAAFLMSIYFYDYKAPFVRSFTLLPTKHSVSLVQRLTRKDNYESIKKFGSRRTFSARHVLQSRLTLFAAVLKKLKNLTSLRLCLRGIDDRKVTVDALLAGCSFQLRAFRASFRFDSTLVSFLQRQPGLRELWVDFDLFYFARLPNEWNSAIPAKALPSLTTLGWSGLSPSIEIIRCLIEGRSVNSVVIDLSDLLPYGEQYYLAEDTVSRRFMELEPYEKQIKHARIIFGVLPISMEHIRHVRVAFSSLLSLTLHFPILVQDIFDKVIASIYRFESVKHLVISGSDYSYIKPSNLSIIAKKCLDSSDALDTVRVVQHDLETSTCNILHQYSRNLQEEGRNWKGEKISY